MDNVERRCRELTDLPPNWDTYGARPVDSITVAGAVALLRRFVPSSLKAAPVVVPTTGGGLQFEWRVGTRSLAVEFTGPAQVSVLYSGEDEEWEKDLTADLTPLSAALARVASPL